MHVNERTRDLLCVPARDMHMARGDPGSCGVLDCSCRLEVPLRGMLFSLIIYSRERRFMFSVRTSRGTLIPAECPSRNENAPGNRKANERRGNSDQRQRRLRTPTRDGGKKLEVCQCAAGPVPVTVPVRRPVVLVDRTRRAPGDPARGSRLVSPCNGWTTAGATGHTALGTPDLIFAPS